MAADPSRILLRPIVTERSLTDQSSHHRYRFLVDVRASKNQISTAFQLAFGIVPQNINTLIIKGKKKTDWKRRQPIQKPDRKIAVITLLPDQKLELLTIKTK